jgi:hypothetical protein
VKFACFFQIVLNTFCSRRTSRRTSRRSSAAELDWRPNLKFRNFGSRRVSAKTFGGQSFGRAESFGPKLNFGSFELQVRQPNFSESILGELLALYNIPVLLNLFVPADIFSCTFHHHYRLLSLYFCASVLHEKGNCCSMKMQMDTKNTIHKKSVMHGCEVSANGYGLQSTYAVDLNGETQRSVISCDRSNVALCKWIGSAEMEICSYISIFFSV